MSSLVLVYLVVLVVSVFMLCERMFILGQVLLNSILEVVNSSLGSLEDSKGK